MLASTESQVSCTSWFCALRSSLVGPFLFGLDLQGSRVTQPTQSAAQHLGRRGQLDLLLAAMLTANQTASMPLSRM